MRNQCCKGRVFRTLDKHHPQNRKRTFIRTMDKMRLQRRMLAIDHVFAWRMEMDLQQLVFDIFFAQRADTARIELDRMAIIQDGQRHRLIVHLIADLACRIRLCQIDRRLHPACCACRIFRRQISPMFRPRLAGIGPMGFIFGCE